MDLTVFIDSCCNSFSFSRINLKTIFSLYGFSFNCYPFTYIAKYHHSILLNHHPIY